MFALTCERGRVVERRVRGNPPSHPSLSLSLSFLCLSLSLLSPFASLSLALFHDHDRVKVEADRSGGRGGGRSGGRGGAIPCGIFDHFDPCAVTKKERSKIARQLRIMMNCCHWQLTLLKIVQMYISPVCNTLISLGRADRRDVHMRMAAGLPYAYMQPKCHRPMAPWP